MYTEDELRRMLEESADRVPRAVDGDLVHATAIATDQPRRSVRRILAPLAVAAAVAAVAGGVVTLTQHRSNEPAAAGTSAPVTSAPTTAGAPARSLLHQATTPIIDVVTVKTANSTENYVEPVGEDVHGQQVVTSQLPHGRTINLVIAPAKGFDGSKFSRSHPVSIAGTTGHYDVLRLFPLSKGGDGGSAPTGTIVFRTSDGHWAFAWLQKGTKNGTEQGSPVNDPSAILEGYDTLNATYVAGQYRTPLRLGYLPGKARFTAADETTSSAPGVTYPSLTTHDGDKQLDISISATSSNAAVGENCHFKILNMCTTTYHRNLTGGGEVTVQGIGYSEAETKKVLDHVQVATDLADRSTYFTLADAIG